MRHALAAATLLAGALAGCGPEAEGPLRFHDAPLIILSIDTLRADRLGCYGNTRGTSPALDAFAQQAVRFENCCSTSCKTAEAHMSLFTSLLPTAHGITNASDRLDIPVRTLAESRLTLPQVLRRAGYFNSAVACGGNLIPAMGFQRGFEQRFVSELVDVSTIFDRGLANVDAALAQDKPWMLFLHTYQVHAPYVPPPAQLARFAPQLDGPVGERVRKLEGKSFKEVFKTLNFGFWDGIENFGAHEAEQLSQLYDGEVAYVDEEFARLVQGLRDKGVWDRAIVVVLSDHGEEFAEHGHFEHDQLYTELLHVPLMVKLPGGRLGGTSVTGPCSLIDVMPTLLELLELEGPETMMGRSLVAAMTSGRAPDVEILAERLMFADSYAATLRLPGAALLYRAKPDALGSDLRPGPGPEPGRPAGEGRIEIYDLRADPGQCRDLGSAAPEWKASTSAFFGRLATLFDLREKLDALGAGGTAALTPEQVAALKSLNYTGVVTPAVKAGSPLESWPPHAGR